MVRTAVHRESIEAPCSPPQADSKCKEMIPFYCSSLANPVAPPKAGFNRASCSIFKHGTQTQTGSESANLALAREQTALALSA
jgi:hypothetical protein